MWLWPLPRLKGDTRCCSAGPVQGCDLLENYGNLVFVGLLSSKPKLITQLDGRAMDGSIRGSIRYLCRTLQTLQGMRIPVLRKYKYLPILGKKKTYFRLQNQAQGTLIRAVCFLKIWLTCVVPHSAWSLMLLPGDQTRPEVDPTTSDTLSSLGSSQEGENSYQEQLWMQEPHGKPAAFQKHPWKTWRASSRLLL
ncbi:zinc finger protein 485 isoform X3 [Physeter macrocephalus]|uniref:Zinc finger protein 485 isoform X3 n=1 Tax=Physeter macrocephalus TaxID=9755 RepID=A0A9W2WDM3_PHYMC|nr:zinc finger protein 485 isoform X3 [Physeter catodon]